MQKLGGAVIHMQQNLINAEQEKTLQKVDFLVGSMEQLIALCHPKALQPFSPDVLDFLERLSKELMTNPKAKEYPDIITLGFWIRKASLEKLKKRFLKEDEDIYYGRGIVFHIAPSNVPVNYAYSLITGLLTGNINIVRIPSKDFPQVGIINQIINNNLEKYTELKKYIYLVRYERNQQINDIFSTIADVRVVWGGDNTIAELRKSPLGPRAREITFADRYSLAVINSDYYCKIENKNRFAEEFYNDTYLTDQNACTSPRIVVWTGSSIEKAKMIFWDELHKLVKSKYSFQAIMGVNKLTSAYLTAATHRGTKIEPHEDNLLIRVKIKCPDDDIMDLKDNSGYFFEFDCKEITEIKNLCDNTHCQTIAYLGDRKEIETLLMLGPTGIDRVVPIGKTMDFDLIWDGYNLYESLTRTIKMNL